MYIHVYKYITIQPLVFYADWFITVIHNCPSFLTLFTKLLLFTTVNCSSILIWNDIMNKVDISVSLFKFKKLLKLYLLSNDLRLGYIYSLLKHEAGFAYSRMKT